MDYGFTQTGNAVQGVINLHDKQRGGIYGAALQMASCLTNRQVSRWVTAQGRPITGHCSTRPLSPGPRERSTASKEGKGTAWPASSTRQQTSAAGVNLRTSTALRLPAFGDLPELVRLVEQSMRPVAPLAAPDGEAEARAA
ncbi:hypothetical protein QFZ70_003558 [Arthrobacter sp. V1I9]|nr:hypothetical protein [Arthrobacter sp. V1I9]